MESLNAVVLMMMRVDLGGLARQTGLKKPAIPAKERRQMARLFQAAVLGACKNEVLEKWRLV